MLPDVTEDLHGLGQSALRAWAETHGFSEYDANRIRSAQIVADVRARRARLCAREDSRGCGDAARRHSVRSDR